MRIAVLSDIHANREALAACLAHARQQGFDRLVFLGDLVGYGADPRWTTETVAREVERGALAILGNHDEAALATSDRMNAAARAAMEWTRGQLEPAHRDFLGRLPLQVEEQGMLFVHASPHQPDAWHYVVDAADAATAFQAMPQARAICGHVHVPALYHLSQTGKVARFAPVAAAAIPLSPSWRWLMVVGSVGQPRDGSPAAGYAMLDFAANTITYQRVPYETDVAARKVREAGLPEVLALRLLQGF